MRTFHWILLFVGFGLIGLQPVHAQTSPEAPAIRPQGSIHFVLGVPQGDFRDNVDDLGFGLDFFGGLGFGQSPLVVGLDLGFLVYGREVRNEPFSGTIPDVRVDVETTNNILKSHVVLRIQPPSGTIRPYLDGLFGLKYLFTQTRIENEGFGDQEPIAQSTNFDDVALSYGVGAGIAVELYRPRRTNQDGEPNPLDALELKLGAQYLFGGEADYLREGSIRRQNGNVTFDVTRSRTTLLVPQLGVSLRF